MQATIGELGEVQPYRFRIDDLDHPHIGFYVTPAGPPLMGCHCDLCNAGREGRDVHLGSISRIAHIRAGLIVTQHLGAAA